MRRNKREQGIALVMILGLLALLMMLGVAFSVYMRTERMTSSMYIDVVRSKEITYAALAEALYEIDQKVGSGVGDTYPRFNEFISLGDVTNKVGDIISGTAENYIPDAVYPDTGVLATQCWTEVVDPIYVTNTIGRYAYLVINCSGLLDVNYAGIRAVRDRNLGVEDIAIESIAASSFLPEYRNMTSDEVRARLPNLLARYKHFYTVPEMNFMMRDSDFGVRDSFPNQTFHYSLATNAWYNKNYLSEGTEPLIPRVYIGRTLADVQSNAVEIQNAFFENYKFADVTVAAAMVDNLIDYLDADNIPQSLSQISVEAVPSINEILITNRVDTIPGPPPAYQNIYQIVVELSYPFVISNQNSYYVECSPDPNGGNFVFATTSKVSSAMTFVPEDLKTVIFEFAAAPLLDIGTAQSVNELPLTVVVTEGTGPDRMVVDSTTLLFQNDNAGANFSVTAGNLKKTGAEVIDPRYNHAEQNTAGSDLWYLATDYSESVGVVNVATVNSPDYLRNGPLFYTRNSGTIDSIVELSALPNSRQPWSSISFVDGIDDIRLLDRFTMVKSEDGALRGLINPNTTNKNILASIFYKYNPGAFATMFTNNVTISNELGLASMIVDKAAGDWFYLNRSDVVTNVNAQSFVARDYITYPLGSVNWNMVMDRGIQEQIIGSFIEMIEPKQQMYTIIMIAQSGKTNPKGDVFFPTGTQKAVAVVWRDPVSRSGVNPCFVRYFHWLGD